MTAANEAFIDRVLAGAIADPSEEVDAAIAAWHKATTEQSLPEWLGMTDFEYGVFLQRPAALLGIIEARRWKALQARPGVRSFLEENRSVMASSLANGMPMRKLYKAVRAHGCDVTTEEFELVCKRLGLEEMPQTIIKPSGRHSSGE